MLGLKIGGFVSGFALSCVVYYKCIALRLYDIHAQQSERLIEVEDKLLQELKDTLENAPGELRARHIERNVVKIE